MTQLRVAKRTIIIFSGLIAAVLFSSAVWASGSPWATGQVQIVGNSLSVSPDYQVVPVNVATVVNTVYGGQEGTFPDSYVIRGELNDETGQVFSPSLVITTKPNQPLLIPALPVAGKYFLKNITLMDGETPISAPMQVEIDATNLIITSVSGHPMTEEEIKESGIVISQDDYKAYRATIGMVLDSQNISIDVPILFSATDPTKPPIILSKLGVSGPPPLPNVLPQGGGTQLLTGLGDLDLEPTIPKFDLPDFGLDFPSLDISGLLILPGHITFLNQIYAVALLLQNNAPGSSPLKLENMKAVIEFPQGSQMVLKQVKTDNPDQQGLQPLLLPTPIDPGMQVQGEFDATTPKAGTYTVTINYSGDLVGLVSGQSVPIHGSASAVITFRDPTFSFTFSHPSVVRANDIYPLRVTVTNTSQVDANSVTFGLNHDSLSGAVYVSDPDYPSEVTLDSLKPGESHTFEFKMMATRNGAVTASSIDVDGNSGHIELTTAVGDSGIPLSPDTLVLPPVVNEYMPDTVVNAAMDVLGLGWSLATCEPAARPANMAPVSEGQIKSLGNELTTVARYLEIAKGKDSPEYPASPYYTITNALTELALDWQGNGDNASLAFDSLRRLPSSPDDYGPSKGIALADAIGAELVQQNQSIVDAHHAFAEAAVNLNPHFSVAFDPGTSTTPPSFWVEDGQGRRLGDSDNDSGIVRNIPWGESYPYGSGRLFVIGKLEDDSSFTVHVEGKEDGSCTISLVEPGSSGLVQLVYNDVETNALSRARIVFDQQNDTPVLENDLNGDGIYDSTIAPTATVVAKPELMALGAMQDLMADQVGRAVAVLFNRPVDKASSEDLSIYSMPGRELTGAYLQPDERIVELRADSRLSPYVNYSLSIDGDGVSPKDMGSQAYTGSLQVVTKLDQPGGTVSGIVYNENGAPAAGVNVYLYEYDDNLLNTSGDSGHPDVFHITQVHSTDSDGRFYFDYVMVTGRSFAVEAVDPATNHSAKIRSIVIEGGQHIDLELFMRGRGTVRGQVFNPDGTPAVGAVVTITPLESGEYKQTKTDDQGIYQIDRLPVDTLSILAKANGGYQATATAHLDEAGDVATVNLYLSDRHTGGVKGHVKEADGSDVPNAIAGILNSHGDGFITSCYADGGGNFELDGLEPGYYGFAILDPASHVKRFQDTIEITGDQVLDKGDIVLDPGPATGEGTVTGHLYNTDGATVVPDALVYIVAGSGVIDQTTTDANGAFTLSNIPMGTWGIKAYDAASHKTAGGSISITYDGQSTGIALYLQGLAVVTGTVYRIDENGNQQVATGAHVYTGGATSYATDGTYTFADLPVGRETQFLAIWGVGVGINYRRILVTPTNDGEVIHRDIVLMGYGDLKVHVALKGTENPVQALVTVLTSKVVTKGPMGNALKPAFFHLEPDLVSGTSDPATGEIEFNHILSTHVSVGATNAIDGSGGAAGTVVPGTTTDIDVYLSKAGTVQGSVYAPDGLTVVPHGIVTLSQLGMPDRVLAADDNGHFEFQMVLRGGLSLKAEDNLTGRTGYANGVLSLPEANPLLNLNVRLLGEGRVRGNVTEDDGEGGTVPAASAQVTIKGLSPLSSYTTTTDSQGQFLVDDVQEGTYSVEVVDYHHTFPLTGRTSVDVSRDSTSQVDLRLGDFGSIEGTLERKLSDDSTVPVANAQITLIDGTGQVGYFVTDSQGQFDFDYVPLNVSLEVQAYDPKTGRTADKKGLQLTTAGQTLDVSLQLQTIGSIVGTVTAWDGTPISDAVVSTWIPGKGQVSTTSASDGQYSLPGLPSGTYQVSAVDPRNGARATKGGDIDDTEGYIKTINLKMPATGTVEGYVYNHDGGIVAAANVTLDGSHSMGAVNGHYRFDGVGMGTYTITASDPVSPDGGSVVAIVSDPSNVVDAPITFVGLGTVTGTVTDGTGAPVEGFRVYLKDNNDYTGTDHLGPVGTSSTGEFTFENIRAGDIKVTAYPPTGSSDSRTGSASGILASGDTLNLAVSLPPVGMLKGILHDEDGNPVLGALVTVTGTSPLGVWTTYTDPDGFFVLPTIPLDSTSNNNYVTWKIAGPFGGHLRGGQTEITQAGIDLGTLTLDTVIPTATTTPQDQASNVPVVIQPGATFSKVMDGSTITAGTVTLKETLSGTAVSGTFEIVNPDPNSTSVTFHPTLQLKDSTDYIFTLSHSITDTNGNPLSGDIVTHFKTVDLTPPTIEEAIPSDGQVQVALDTTITISFSESVDHSTLSADSLTLTGPNGDVSCYVISVEDITTEEKTYTQAVFVPCGDCTQTPPPTIPLTSNATYTMQISGVKDLAGNIMALWQIAFNTVDTIPPLVSLDLPSGTVGPEESVTIGATAIDNLMLDRVEFYADGTLIGTKSVPPYEVVYTTPAGAGGTVAVEVMAYDKGHNVASDSGDLVWVSDATPPNIVIPSPQNGQEVYSGDKLEMQAEVTDESGVTSVEFRLEDSQGALLWSQEVDTAPYQASYPVSGITDEVNRSVVVRAVDVFGNEALSNPVTVTFVPAGEITGHVYQSDGQKVEGGAQVVFSKEGGFSRTVNANTKGYYESGALPVGIYSVVAHTSGGYDASMAKFPEVGPEATVECNLTLMGTGTITGHVVDGDNGGADIQGAKVAFSSRSGIQQSLETYTDGNGEFSLSYVLAGNYSISVYYPDDGPIGDKVFGTMTANGHDDYDPMKLYSGAAFVAAFSPADGSTEVDVSTPVTITFSQPVDADTLDAGIDVEYSFLPYRDGTHALAENWSLSADGLTATMTSPTLTVQRAYRIFVRNVLSANNKSVLPAESRFSTRTPPQPLSLTVVDRDTGDTVAVTTPPDETRDVPLRASIDVTFDQDIDPASVADSLIDLWPDQGVQITGTVQLQADGRTLEFIPSQDLSTDNLYHMMLNWGLKGTDGDQWGINIALSDLYTQDTQPPIAAILSPPDQAWILDGADWLPVETISQDGDNYCGNLTTTLSVNENEVSSRTEADCEPTRSELNNSIPTTGGQPVSLTESVTDAADHTATSAVTLNSVTIESGKSAVLSDYPRQMVTLGDRVYLEMNDEKTIKIFDVDPAGLTAPQLRGSFTVQDYVECLVIDGKVLWMGLSNGNLVGYDVSDPQTPLLLSTTFVGGCDTYCYIQSLAVSAGYAYVAGEDKTLHIYSLDDPSNPVEDWSYQFAAWPAVQVENGLMLVNAGSQLFLYDVNDPRSPTLLNNHIESLVNYHDIEDTILEGGFLYIGYYQDNTNLMSVVDIADPSSPVMKYATYVFDSYELDRVRYGDLLLGGFGYFSATNLPYGGQPSEAGVLWSPEIYHAGSNSSGVTVVGDNGTDYLLETLRLNVPKNGTSLSIVSPTDGSTVQAKSLVPVVVTPNLEFTGSVDLYINGVLTAERNHKPYNFRYWLPSSTTPGPITLEATLVDDSGETIHSNVVTLNVEAADTTPPEVVSTAPTDNAIDVPTSVYPSAEFNEPLDPQSVSNETVSLTEASSGTAVGGTVSLSEDGKTITFKPDANLTGQVQYTFSLGSSILDLSGNAFAGQDIHFTCLDDEPPTAYIIEPSDGSYVVGGDTSVRFSFSDNNGVVSASLLVNGVEVASVDPSTFDGPGFIAIPPIAQPEGSDVTLQIQVADAAGNTGLSEPVNVKALWDVSESFFNVFLGDDRYVDSLAASESRVATGGETVRLYDTTDFSAPVAESTCSPYRLTLLRDFAAVSSENYCSFVPDGMAGGGGILTMQGWDLAAEEGLAAVLPVGSDYGVALYNLRDPSGPVLVTEFQISDDVPGWTYGLWLSGSKLLVETEDDDLNPPVNHLAIYDVSNPAAPVFEKEVLQEVDDGVFVGKLFLAEDFNGGVAVYDFSIPAQMTQIASIPTSGNISLHAFGNRFLRVTHKYSQQPDDFYDLSDPSSPTLLYTARSGGSLDGSGAQQTTVAGSHLLSIANAQFDEGGGYVAALSDVSLSTHDINAPNVAITAPSDGSTLGTSSGWWMVSADVSDDVGIAWVDVLANGRLIQRKTRGPWTFVLPVPSDLIGEPFTLEIRAADLSGNSTSATETLSFDDAAVGISMEPSGSLTAPVGAWIDLQAKAEMAGGVDRLEFTVNGSPVATLNEPPYTYRLAIDPSYEGQALLVDATTYHGTDTLTTENTAYSLAVQVEGASANVVLDGLDLALPGEYMAISPDGSYLAVSGLNGVSVYSPLDSYRLVFNYPEAESALFSPDGTMLMVNDPMGGGAGYLTAAEENKRKAKLVQKDHKRWEKRGVKSPKTMGVSQNGLKWIQLWGPQPAHCLPVVSPDGLTLAYVDDLFNLQLSPLDGDFGFASEPLSSLYGVQAVRGLSYAPDGRTLFVSVEAQGPSGLQYLLLRYLVGTPENPGTWGDPVTLPEGGVPRTSLDGTAVWIVGNAGELSIVDLSQSPPAVSQTSGFSFQSGWDAAFHPGGTTCSAVDPSSSKLFDMSVSPPAELTGTSVTLPSPQQVIFDPRGEWSYVLTNGGARIDRVFTASADAWAPRVVSSAPAPGGTIYSSPSFDDVSSLLVFLSEPMDESTINESDISVTSSVDGTLQPGAVTYANCGTVVTWTASQPLGDGSYLLKLEGLKDEAGNVLPTVTIPFFYYWAGE